MNLSFKKAGAYKPKPGTIFLATPKAWWDKLDEEFHFTLDVAADSKHHMTKKYYTQGQNALTKPWKGVVWCSPPWNYTVLPTWLKKAVQESRKHSSTVVVLLPVRPDTTWWHEIVLQFASEIRFINGHLKYVPFDDSLGNVAWSTELSCLAVFGPIKRGATIARSYPST